MVSIVAAADTGAPVDYRVLARLPGSCPSFGAARDVVQDSSSDCIAWCSFIQNGPTLIWAFHRWYPGVVPVKGAGMSSLSSFYEHRHACRQASFSISGQDPLAVRISPRALASSSLCPHCEPVWALSTREAIDRDRASNEYGPLGRRSSGIDSHSSRRLSWGVLVAAIEHTCVV